MRHSCPDKQWLLAVLSTLQPGHAVFQKGYRPPSKAKLDAQQEMVPNRNGFFDGLEPLSSKELRRHGGISFQSKK